MFSARLVAGEAVAMLAGVDAGLEYADMARAFRHDGPVTLIHLKSVGVG